MGVEAVFGLVEDGLGVGFEDVAGDFFAAVGGEAVHDEGGAAGGVEGRLVDLVAGELGETEGGFVFFAHADPHVGVEDIGTRAGGEDIGRDADMATGTLQEFGGRLEFGGGGDAQGKAEARGGPDPRAGHVAIAVADEGDGESVEGASFFDDGEEVAENLAGMFLIGEGVDGAEAAEFGEFLDVALGVGADDGAVGHAAHDAGGVADGFAAAELDVVGGEKNGLSAQFADTDFEAEAGAGGGFGKHEGPAFAGQGQFGMWSAVEFHLGGAGEDVVDRRGVERFDIEEVFHRGRGEFRTKDARQPARCGGFRRLGRTRPR